MQYVCSTAGCGKITEQRKCERHRHERQRRQDHKTRLRYYTARWKRLRQHVLERDNHLCQECLKLGKTAIGNQIDHIVKAVDDIRRFWDASNLQTLCVRCHSRKTALGD